MILLLRFVTMPLIVFSILLAEGVTRAEDPVRLRILSYNIHHAEGVDRKLDLERIAKVILASKPDLVALQEVDRNVKRTKTVDQPTELARLTKMNVAFGANIKLQGGEYGNAILSKFPIHQNKNDLLPNVDQGEQRGVLKAQIKVPKLKQPLMFLATHLDYRRDDRERLASARQINTIVAKSTNQPALLAGDLNAVPISRCLKELEKQWIRANEEILPTVPVQQPKRQIDYVLFSKADHWKVIDVKVLDEDIASDHRAIFAVLELLPQKKHSAGRAATSLESIKVSEDGSSFIKSNTGKQFKVWGVNYDHDGSGRLLDEYWIDEWDTVVEDFQEIKALGANCIRIHLQVGKFMEAPDKPNAVALKQLAKLVQLAEKMGLYLDVTGLACYHKKQIPKWYDSLDEQNRWSVQAVFWEAIAKTCNKSPAIFCYDLMNEPVLPGKKPAQEWLAGELGGKYFVQRLTLDLGNRTREQVAAAWVDRMFKAIRKHDKRHMITVGVIPWVFVFGGGKPLFYSPKVSKQLDFVAVHFYPKKGEIDKALKALKAYDIGKPLVVEEMFPLKCNIDELTEFVDKSAAYTDGWISFYWGNTAKQLLDKKPPTIADAITAKWLQKFSEISMKVKTGN